MLWSMVANIGAYVVVSGFTRQSVAEQAQAARFVDVFRRAGDGPDVHVWKGTASLPDLLALLARFLGPERATAAVGEYARRRGYASPAEMPADAGLVQFAETELAGAIGGASARIMVASTVKEDVLSIDEVRTMLDEASQVIAYSHELEKKSREVMAATAELRAANERLTGARPAEGRFRLDGHPRAAHAADVDPGVFRDPARQSRSRLPTRGRNSSTSSSRRASG